MQRKFKRDFNELKNILTMTKSVFHELGLNQGLRKIVDLATEELFANLVTCNTKSDKDILIEMVPHALGLEVRLTDFDVERFDPATAGSVDTKALPGERAPGSMGLYQVMKMVDSIHCEYQDRQSKISFIVFRH